MSPELRSLLPSLMALGVVAVVAMALTVGHSWSPSVPVGVAATVRLAAATVLGQAVHFTEELLTGFASRFPALFGLVPMPARFFVAFNLAWLAIWAVAVMGLARLRRWALFPLWFLGLAAVLNGLAHPAMAWRTGGYFPGLVSAPVIAVLGMLLLGRLRSLTVSR